MTQDTLKLRKQCNSHHGGAKLFFTIFFDFCQLRLNIKHCNIFSNLILFFIIEFWHLLFLRTFFFLKLNLNLSSESPFIVHLFFRKPFSFLWTYKCIFSFFLSKLVFSEIFFLSVFFSNFSFVFSYPLFLKNVFLRKLFLWIR